MVGRWSGFTRAPALAGLSIRARRDVDENEIIVLHIGGICRFYHVELMMRIACNGSSAPAPRLVTLHVPRQVFFALGGEAARLAHKRLDVGVLQRVCVLSQSHRQCSVSKQKAYMYM